MNDTDGPAFLERELVGLGVDEYRKARVHDRAGGSFQVFLLDQYFEEILLFCEMDQG